MNNIEKIINELELLRKKALKHFYIVGGILLIIAIIAIITNTLFILMILVIVGALVLSFSPSANKFKLNYKRTLVNGILAVSFENIKFDIYNGLSQDVVASSFLYNMGNRFYSNDLIEADYKDVHFKQSDVLIQYRTSGKHKTTRTYFKGRWIIFDFNKQLSGFTQVKQRSLFGSGKPSWWSKTFHDAPSCENIEMESISFNEVFSVNTDNPHEAFYILTPSLMELMESLNQKHPEQISFAFFNHQLHIAIYNHKDAFEPSIFKAVTIKDINLIKDDINCIINLIDVLRLNENIYA